VLLKVVGDAAKARGMAQVSKDSDVDRESRYKALSPGAKPRYETVAAVMRAVNVKMMMGVELNALSS
jgi:probable addiction module antidote protein